MLQTKKVDVVVAKEGIGPCIGVSLKGTLKSFRNLTNRMEEAVGECTNLHIAYPALVCGFLHFLRATREKAEVHHNDVAVKRTGEVVDSIARYHDVLARLAGRDDVRSEPSKYESVAVALVDPDSTDLLDVSSSGTLTFQSFFDKLYTAYDLRFVFAAPALAKATRRLEWDPASPALKEQDTIDYEPRLRLDN